MPEPGTDKPASYPIAILLIPELLPAALYPIATDEFCSPSSIAEYPMATDLPDAFLPCMALVPNATFLSLEKLPLTEAD